MRVYYLIPKVGILMGYSDPQKDETLAMFSSPSRRCEGIAASAKESEITNPEAIANP